MRTIGLSALLLSISLSGCGGSDTSTGNEAPAATGGAAEVAKADPCSFITPAEVAAITGSPVSRATKSGDTCKYHANPDDGAEVTVDLTDGVKKMDIARKTAELLGGIGKHVAQKDGAGADTGALLTASKDSPGIGDESLWGVNGTVTARDGAAFVEVMAPVMHDPAVVSGIPLIPAAKRREIAVAIAARVLENIRKTAR